jgi:RNA polymerase sigma factor (sigma-70 family)
MRDQEYQALRQFIRLTDSSDAESTAYRVAEAVQNELTPRQRELVRLYYISQMTMYDIASLSGVSVSTVSRTLKRARGRLRKFLRYSGRILLEKIEE